MRIISDSLRNLIGAFFLGGLSCCPSSAGEPDKYRAAAEPTTKAEIYGQGVRETPWLKPEDEAKGFHLPPGFVADLVAAEPQISKPLNMAFDARGRLWVTCTIEYPYAVPEGKKSRDTIRILEDKDGDGNFESMKIFADDLNIPIGILPVQDGVICFSIPNIWLLKDADRDDRVDERIRLFGPFDTTRDTHGMINGLRQGSDGWIYACHGYNNRSSVTARDGSKVELNSGNTFRFLPDGSRIEQFTVGQVNPFGMCSDEFGTWFTADCHSKPLTALLPGACYPSFSRPHDGLGFAPSMMEHLHASTAICGVEYYQGDKFPKPFQHLFFSGNVMTSRINCNALERRGATIAAKELGDFMTSDDPWYRPVDIIQGPDGALYVADFYNKIIGHYEVPLTHPERDRESGRIWRIRYQGEATKSTASTTARRVAKEAAEDILSRLDSPDYHDRRLAVEAEMQIGSLSQTRLEQLASDKLASIAIRRCAVEILTRRSQMPPALLAKLLQSDANPEFQVQLIRTVCGWSSKPGSASSVLMVLSSLASSKQADVARSALEALGRWGDRSHLDLLTRTALQVSENDPVMLQAARIAIRNILQRDDAQIQAYASRWKSDRNWSTSRESQLIVNILPGIPTTSAAQALLEYVAALGDSVDSALRTAAIEHASRNPDERLLTSLLKMVEQTTVGNPLQRSAQIVQISNTFPPSTRTNSVELRILADKTLVGLLEVVTFKIANEGPSMHWLDLVGRTWNLEPRKCSDGQAIELLSSLPRGENYVGQLSSETFKCPERLSFWIAGHNGPPDKTDQGLNYVALIGAKSGQMLVQAFPPRNDTANLVVWDLKQFAGQEVRFRIVDADYGNAYAWLGVARFSLPALQVGTISQPLEAISTLFKLGFGSNELFSKLLESTLSARQRTAAIAARLEGQGAALAATLASQSLALGRTDLVTDSLYVGDLSHEAALAFVTELCKSAAGSQQSSLAQALLKSERGCELLGDVLNAGLLNPASLKGAPALLPKSLSAERKEQLKNYFSAAEAAGLDTALVAKRLAEVKWSNSDAERGKQLFNQHCSNCHQLAGQGATIGPQLDGAVQRSAERLAEDLLLPNLNVDKSFRTTSFLLQDGSIVSGVIKEEKDGVIQVVGSDAKTKSISAADVEQRKESELSLMPANFSELLNAQHLADLLVYLNQTAKR